MLLGDLDRSVRQRAEGVGYVNIYTGENFWFRGSYSYLYVALLI